MYWMLKFGNIDILLDKQAEILPHKQMLWSFGVFFRAGFECNFN